MNDNTWIKLYRKFTKWEWYNISEMVHLFIHLLVSANNEEDEWHGILVKRGQLITGLNSLQKATNISFQTLRTCLKRLEKTKEINIQSTNKYTVITICKYDDYQPKQQTTNKQTNKQLTNKQQTTNNKQDNKDIKINLYSDFYDSEIINANGDEEYLKIVKALYGENNLNIPLNSVLKLDVQLSYIQFTRIQAYRRKYNFSTIQVLEDMENWKDLKKKKTIYGTFQTFLKNDLKLKSL